MTKGIFQKNRALLCTLVALMILMITLPLQAQEQAPPTASSPVMELTAQDNALAHETARVTELQVSAESADTATMQLTQSAAQDAQSAAQDAQSAAQDAQSAAQDTQSATQDVRSVTQDAQSVTQDTQSATQDNAATTQQGKESTGDTKTSTPPADNFNKFKVLLIPYIWCATTSTDLKVRDRTANAVITPGEAAKYLQGAIAARIEASQGHFGGFIDINALRLENTVTPNYRNVTMSFTSGVNNYGLFYRFKGTPVFDIYAGARTYDFTTDLTIEPGRILQGRSISRNRNWTDLIIGARMNAPLSKNLGIIVSGDVGGISGNSSSWQFEGLVEWKLSPSFSLQGGYKSLYFENTYDSNFIDNISVKSRMYGPILKLQFGF